MRLGWFLLLTSSTVLAERMVLQSNVRDSIWSVDDIQCTVSRIQEYAGWMWFFSWIVHSRGLLWRFVFWQPVG